MYSYTIYLPREKGIPNDEALMRVRAYIEEISPLAVEMGPALLMTCGPTKEFRYFVAVRIIHEDCLTQEELRKIKVHLEEILGCGPVFVTV